MLFVEASLLSIDTQVNSSSMYTASVDSLEPNILFPKSLYSEFKKAFQTEERCKMFPYLCGNDDTKTIFGGDCLSLSQDIVKEYVLAFLAKLKLPPHFLFYYCGGWNSGKNQHWSSALFSHD